MHWLKTPQAFALNLIRPPWVYISTVLAGGLVIVAFVLAPYLVAKATTHQQTVATQAAAEQARSLAASLPGTGSLNRLTPGQTGSVKTVADSLQTFTDDFKPLSLSRPAFICHH